MAQDDIRDRTDEPAGGPGEREEEAIRGAGEEADEEFEDVEELDEQEEEES